MKISWPTNGSVMILKPSAAERLAVVGLADDLLFHVVRVVTDHGRNIERAGQVIDHSVEQRLHALVLERRAAEHREDVHRDGRLADASLQLRLGRLLTLEVQVHDLVVGVGDRLDQVVASLFGRLEQVGGNLFDRVLGAHGLVVPVESPSS